MQKFIIERLEVSVPGIRDDVVIEKYTSSRITDGALTIRSESKKKDPFDLPPKNLKRLIQGFVWGDRHFLGESVLSIARSEKVSEAFVLQTMVKALVTFSQTN